MKTVIGVVSVALCASALVVGCGGKVVFDAGTGGSGGAISQSSATLTPGTTTHAVSTNATSKASVGSTVVAVGSSGAGTPCEAQCESMFSQGFPLLEHRVVRSCGCHPMAPCDMECFMKPECSPMMGPPPSGDCATCINQISLGDQCFQDALLSMQCQGDPACAQLADCILTCN